MTKPRRAWTVLPHDPIEKIDDNLWGVSSKVPGTPISRRMCIIKMADGRLMFWHAVPLDDKTLAEVTAWGKPAILVVGHDQHTIDADAFAKKLQLKTYGPKARIKQLRQRIDLDGTFEDLAADPTVSVTSIRGSKFGEALVVVKSGEGKRVSLLFSDVIQNNNPASIPFIFRALGFAGGPKIVPAYRLLFTSDKKALRSEFDTWAALPNLARIVPFHGSIVSSDLGRTLSAIGATL